MKTRPMDSTPELHRAARLGVFAAATKPVSIPVALRNIARLRRVTFRRLAASTGFHAWRVERVLNERVRPHEGELEAIAAALGVTADKS